MSRLPPGGTIFGVIVGGGLYGAIGAIIGGVAGYYGVDRALRRIASNGVEDRASDLEYPAVLRAAGRMALSVPALLLAYAVVLAIGLKWFPTLLVRWLSATHGVVEFAARYVPALPGVHERLEKLGYDAEYSPLLNLIAVGWGALLLFVPLYWGLLFAFPHKGLRSSDWRRRLAAYSNWRFVSLVAAVLIATPACYYVCFDGAPLGILHVRNPVIDTPNGLLMMVILFGFAFLVLNSILSVPLIAYAKWTQRSLSKPAHPKS